MSEVVEARLDRDAKFKEYKAAARRFNKIMLAVHKIRVSRFVEADAPFREQERVGELWTKLFYCVGRDEIGYFGEHDVRLAAAEDMGLAKEFQEVLDAKLAYVRSLNHWRSLKGKDYLIRRGLRMELSEGVPA